MKWLLAANLDTAGNAATDVKKPFGSMTFYNPIGMTLGTDGALYVIEYGDIYFAAPSGQRISRIEYTGTCLPKEATGLAGVSGGAQGRARLEARLDQGRILWVFPGGGAARGFIDARGRR